MAWGNSKDTWDFSYVSANHGARLRLHQWTGGTRTLVLRLRGTRRGIKMHLQWRGLPR